jgi:hypothetical protein
LPKPPCSGDAVDVGQLTSFRDLRYDPRLGPSGRLVETPIAEYLTLRGPVLAKTESTVTLSSKVATTVFALPAGPTAADIELNVTLTKGGSLELGFGCGSSTTRSSTSDADKATTAAGAAGCGYSLSLKASQEESTVTVCAATATTCTTYPLLQHEVDALVSSAGLSIPVRVMTDTRSIEIFVHDGRAAHSDAIAYAACENGPCNVSATAAGDGIALSAVAWGMGSITAPL